MGGSRSASPESRVRDAGTILGEHDFRPAWNWPSPAFPLQERQPMPQGTLSTPEPGTELFAKDPKVCNAY